MTNGLHVYPLGKPKIHVRISSVCNNANGCRTQSYVHIGGGSFKTTTKDDYNREKYSVIDPSGKTIESGDLTGILKFEYDSWGNVVKTTTGNSVVSSAAYDLYSRKSQMNEISSGITTYEYNGFGEITKQTDALGHTTQSAYDVLGRTEIVIFPEGKTTYSYYNNPGQGAGNNLSDESRYDANGALLQAIHHDFDNLGRSSGINFFQQPGITQSSNYSYDAYSRLSTTSYSSGLTTQNTYNMGALHQVFVNRSLVEEVKRVNGRGQPLEVWRGNNITTFNKYEQGNLIRRHTPGVQDYNLEYDFTKGLITRRRDDVHGLWEDFTYDAADRLTRSELSNGINHPQEQTYGQSALSSGNIVAKSDIGLYSYDNHIIKYNDNVAGAFPQNVQDVTYTSFHRPGTIKEDAFDAKLTYGTDNERIIYELNENGTLKYQKQYLPDGVEIIVDGAGNKTVVTYVPGASGLALIQTDLYNPAGIALPSVQYYPYTDHLGSLNALVSYNSLTNTASLVHEQAFDPWGRRRDVTTWAIDDLAVPPANMAWLRGFTGHEHLDEFSLVNMNARLYDPKLGRMLSVDNFVSVPGSAMGYNRYTYAHNNPLSYADPTGNFLDPISAAILIGAAIGGLSYTAQAGFSPGGLSKNFNIGGFLGSVNISAVSGAVSYGVGSVFGGTASGGLSASSVFNEAGRAVAHGLVGMGFSVVQGGDAWSGFLAGFAGSVAGSAVPMSGMGFTKTLVGGGLFSMGVGAGTSYITGGDPWIGAALGGLSFYANHMLHGDGGGDGEKEKKQVVKGDPNNPLIRAVNDNYGVGSAITGASIGIAGTSTGKSLMYGGRYAISTMTTAEQAAMNAELKFAGRMMTRFGYTIGWTGVALGAADMISNKNYTTSATLDIAMTGVGMWGVYGWAVSTGYVITNEYLKATTGKSVGQYIDIGFQKASNFFGF